MGGERQIEKSGASLPPTDLPSNRKQSGYKHPLAVTPAAKREDVTQGLACHVANLQLELP